MLVFNLPIYISNCNLDNTPLLGKVDSLSMCSRKRLYSLISLSLSNNTTETKNNSLLRVSSLLYTPSNHATLPSISAKKGYSVFSTSSSRHKPFQPTTTLYLSSTNTESIYTIYSDHIPLRLPTMTPFFIFRLLLNVNVLIYILKSLFYLKKTREAKKNFIFKPSNATQSTITSIE